jgi:hypothetical protein
MGGGKRGRPRSHPHARHLAPARILGFHFVKVLHFGHNNPIYFMSTEGPSPASEGFVRFDDKTFDLGKEDSLTVKLGRRGELLYFVDSSTLKQLGNEGFVRFDTKTFTIHGEEITQIVGRRDDLSYFINPVTGEALGDGFVRTDVRQFENGVELLTGRVDDLNYIIDPKTGKKLSNEGFVRFDFDPGSGHILGRSAEGLKKAIDPATGKSL